MNSNSISYVHFRNIMNLYLLYKELKFTCRDKNLLSLLIKFKTNFVFDITP